MQLVPESHEDPRGEMGRKLRELARALEDEAEIVRGLRDALIQQRAAVAADDAGGVNGSVEAISRILHTLEEARARRTGIVGVLSGDPALPLERLEASIDRRLPEDVGAARAALRRAAEEVAQQAAINRAVLRRAVETGEAFLQALFSSTNAPAAVYGSGDRKDENRPASGVLFNRVV